MLGIEKQFKKCKFLPIKVAGEIIFGSKGEKYEEEQISEVML
jgi:hypothetical protein